VGKKHYEWDLGNLPPILGQHSVAKHAVLRAYLEKYVEVLTPCLAQETLKLTLVDGFAGGGLYQDPTAQDLISGSPLIMLEAMKTAEVRAQEARTKKPFHLDVDFLFVETKKPTIEFLKNQLRSNEIARSRQKQIDVLHGEFGTHLDKIISRIEQKGKSRRAIFVLDQYGFTDVRMADLKDIFYRLPNAEVILTIAIDWLIDHWTDKAQYDAILKNLGISLDPGLAARLKEQHAKDWRRVIQYKLHNQIFENSGASFYTPFFIRSVDAHRSYWLLHLSGHAKARDVMMQLHWEFKNHFEHFGKAGFTMLGYDPRKDLELAGQTGVQFLFDDAALAETRIALAEDLPRQLMTYKKGIAVSEFFGRVVNGTPATREIILSEARRLSKEGEIEIYAASGTRRKEGVQKDSDILIKTKQQFLFLRNTY